MPRPSLTASLLRSGFQAVDQTNDGFALPLNYLPQPVPHVTAKQRNAKVSSSTSDDYVSVGDYTFYTGSTEEMTGLRVYFYKPDCGIVSGIKIGYPNNVWTKVMGQQTANVQAWDRQKGELVTRFTASSATEDGSLYCFNIFSPTRGWTSFGRNWASIQTYYMDTNLPPLNDLQVYYDSKRIIWLQYVGKYVKTAGGTGGDTGTDGDLTLSPLPCNMRLEAQLARDATGDIESDGVEKLFQAKVQAGKAVGAVLARIADLDESKAWVKYYNRKLDQTVYVCESQDTDGEIYIWTRGVGTTDQPEHVTQIGYQGGDLIVCNEWSLVGKFGKDLKNISQTSLAFKSWFTKYVKDSTGAIKNKADQALKDALAGAGVITTAGVLTVKYEGSPSAAGANVINSFTVGIWAILACESFVKQVIAKPYLVVDTLNFDKTSDWAKVLTEGDDDIFLGSDGGVFAIPKIGGSVYPALIALDAGDISVCFTTNLFLEPCTVRKALASFDSGTSNPIQNLVGCVVTASSDAASVGISVLQTSGGDIQSAAGQLAKLKAPSDVGATSTPSTIIATASDAENGLQKVSVLLGKYA
ncbi:uncharacterized protein FIBRA_04241 [Fibroporia radiculosa]|uniref:Uncharacterized protein n=1 Tax=Fibroporia radiculosa TaxID=599839 RepID=J4G725_9APHY|nr:uncharacterized protein FIBRA_04241 [Fibroporia radiculosa]CCM02163.1 predicted protein [Fibroporia radiculosa]